MCQFFPPPDPPSWELTLNRSHSTKPLYEFPFDVIKLFWLDWCPIVIEQWQIDLVPSNDSRHWQMWPQQFSHVSTQKGDQHGTVPPNAVD